MAELTRLVLLQPMKEEPPINAKCKDKFLVQSAFIAPDDELKSLAEMVRDGFMHG